MGGDEIAGWRNLLAASGLAGLRYVLHALDGQSLSAACGASTSTSPGASTSACARSRAFDPDFMANMLGQFRGVACECVGGSGVVGEGEIAVGALQAAFDGLATRFGTFRHFGLVGLA